MSELTNQATSAAQAGPLRFSYRGENGAFFSLYLKNLLLTLVTLGIYSFWAKVSNTQYIYQHLSFQDRPFNYHATGKELFMGFLKGLGIALVFILCLTLASMGLTKALGPIVGPIVLALLLVPGYIFLIPFLMHGKFKFWLARTSWSNVRFRFNGKYKELLIIFLKTLFFTIITLGLYIPFWIHHVQRYFTDNASIGQARFQYNGTGKEMFWMYIKGMLLSIITVGIYFPWFAAKLCRYIYGNTTLAGKPLRCDLTGGQYFKLLFGNFFIVVFTLGLAFPVAINRQMRTIFQSLEIDSDDSILQGIMVVPDNEASALAGGLEQAADALDAVSGIL